MRKRFIASRGLNVRHLSEVGAANKRPVEGLLYRDLRLHLGLFVADLIVPPYVTQNTAFHPLPPPSPRGKAKRNRAFRDAPVRGGGWSRGWAPANLLSVFRVGAEQRTAAWCAARK